MIDKSFGAIFPNRTLECPFKPGKFYAMNMKQEWGVDSFLSKRPDQLTKSSALGVEYPNGVYRYTVKLSTKEDPMGFFIQWRLEIRFRFNDETF
jgi:hypothetical protein